MAWNHSARIVAVAVAMQAGAGNFVQPNPATDIIGVSNPTNTHDPITADDPTATGTKWESNPAKLGKTATVGFTIPLRGPGGAVPPAANAWAPGRVLQACGFAEVIKAASSTAALAAGSTETSFVLANTESAVNNFLVGAPIQHADLGAGFRGTTLVQSYDGATKTATIAEELAAAAAAGSDYTIPAYMSYVLGALTGEPVYLSISVWRHKKRYDYRDWQPNSWALTMPVANEANTSFSDITTSGKAQLQGTADELAPEVPVSILNVPLPPARDGKFFLDRVKLGHQQVTFTINYTTGAASNQNAAAGQDAYDVQSANRTVALDLNQMNLTDFDIDGEEEANTIMPLLSTWGLGGGNRFGFLVPNMMLHPVSPGERNGYVSLTGNAYATDVDKSAALSIWW